MNEECSASSSKTPRPTARHNKKQKTGSKSSEQQDQVSVQKELSNNMWHILKSMESVANASVLSEMNKLKEQRFKLKMQKLDAMKNSDNDVADMIEEQVVELTNDIQQYECQL